MTAATRFDGLGDARAHGRLGVYLTELWARRSYAWYVSESELRNRQIHTALGNLWFLLNPILSIAVYFLIFGLVLQTDRGLDSVSAFLLFLTVGLFVFQFTQRSVTQGATSIVSNRGVVRLIRFPRALLPITTTLTEALAAIPTLAVIYVVALATGQPPRLAWLLLPAIVVWQVMFNLGAAFVAARLTTRFRDTQQVLPFLFRLVMYGSGVIFSVDAYVTNPRYELFFVLNPMYGFISIARWAVMGLPVGADVVIAAAVWTIVLLIGGFTWFRAAEHSYDCV